MRESSNSATRIGTTRRGIGPAYEDKVGRRAIRLMDLADIPALKPKIERLLAHHNALRRGLGLAEIAPAALHDELAAVAPRVLPFMDSVWSLLDRKRLELARALALNPKLLLLDEIAGGLTEHETHALIDTIRAIHARGTTIVWIEHIVHALVSIASRLMVMNYGQKLAEGAPQAVMADARVREVYMGI